MNRRERKTNETGRHGGRRIRRGLLLVLPLLLETTQPVSSQTWEQSVDPENLCSDSRTGYFATLDCRGYVYCNDGYLMGGVIECWPNQLFDEIRGTCSYWQQVDTVNGCPDFDGSHMMPDQMDENANEQRFFCGVSASNAKRVCEPCPGGSRAECTDLTHNCFAGITGCTSSKKNDDDGGGGGSGDEGGGGNDWGFPGGGNGRPSPDVSEVAATPRPTPRPTPWPTRLPTSKPTPRPVAQFAVVTAPDNDDNGNVMNGSNNNNDNTNNNNNNNNNHPTSTSLTNETYLHGSPRSSFYCGWSWDTTLASCRSGSAPPCPSGLNDECPTLGQTCFPDTPCGDAPIPTGRPTPRPVGVGERTYYCGYDWDWVVSNCARATPCPYGDASGVCPSGMRCVADTPCYAENNGLPTPKPTPLPVKVSYPPVKGDDPVNRYCGYDWTWVVSNCERTSPCPGGDSAGVCPMGMRCIAETPCFAIKNGLPTPKPTPLPVKVSYPPVKGDDPANRFCGYDWADVTANCLIAVPCPYSADVCPMGMRCIAETPCVAMKLGLPTPKPTPIPTRISYPPVKGDDPAKRFCGYDWADVTANCLIAVPCPSGVSQGVCPDRMNCIAETQCADETYLQWLRDKQANNGSGRPLVQNKPDTPTSVAVPAPTPPATETTPTSNNNVAQGDGRCTSDADCRSGGLRFCHRPDPSMGGRCGECRPRDGTGCDTVQVCRTPGCHGGPEEPGVARCHERSDPWKLNADCEARLNQVGARCNVDTMVCVGGNQQQLQTTTTQQQQQQQQQQGNAAVSAPPVDVGSGAMFENPEGNSFFCGAKYSVITENCLRSKPCPGGRAADYCAVSEGCFSAPSCTQEYISAATAPMTPNAPREPVIPLTPNPTSPPSRNPTPIPSAKLITIPTQIDPEQQGASDDAVPAQTTSTALPSKAPTINTNFCGVSWSDHKEDCANSTPCPNGNEYECPDGETCFNNSPCAMLVNGQENVSVESRFGNFCGTEWNELTLMCKSATRCTPDGSECAEGEFCYQNFDCNPPPVTTTTTTAATTTTTTTTTMATISPIAALFFSPTTSSPSESPTTPLPSKSPTINTNFCGVSWSEHAVDCSTSTPCPNGDECALGEKCFGGSPCAKLTNGLENAILESNVGNFCGTDWNELQLMCKSATKCTPNGNECADGEFCYQDFECDPPPPPATRSPSTAATNPLAKNDNNGNNPTSDSSGSSMSNVGQGTNQAQPQEKLDPADSCSLCGSAELDWSERVTFEEDDVSCGEFGWIFLAEKISEGSARCLNFRAQYFNKCCYAKPVGAVGCQLCDAGMDEPWHDIRESVNVMFDGYETTCANLSNKLRTRFEPLNGSCIDTKNEHFESCCFERCGLCGDANLDWEASVTFSGEEVLCHELDSRIFVEEQIAADSSRCLMSQGFYADSCCIQPPEVPCNICSANQVHYNMKSKTQISYNGEERTCLEVYHFLFARHEQSSVQCTDAQREVFDQCCEVFTGQTTLGGSASGSAISSPTMSPTKEEPDKDFDSWYTYGIPPSASSFIVPLTPICLSIVVGFVAFC